MQTLNHVARKRFGQNFLCDTTVIDNIIAHLRLRNDEHWVEIGPGQGALTKPILQADVKLDAVELDRDLVARLRETFKHDSNFAIHSADALSFDFTKLVKDGEQLRIVGNLPYNISTPLLFHLVEFAPHIQDMHFMLQKEVVARMCAAPGTKDYGRLSVMMQYYCVAEALFDVDPGSFQPVPQVMSTIVRLVPYKTPPVLLKDTSVFSKLVAQAFSQRRKTIRNSLKTLIPQEDFLSLGMDATVRAENLSLADFAVLSNHLAAKALT